MEDTFRDCVCVLCRNVDDFVEQYQRVVEVKEKGRRKKERYIFVLVGTAVSVFSEINRIA